MSGTVGAALAAATRRLEAAGVDSPARDARDLLAWALGTEPLQITLRAAEPLPAEAAARYETALAARAARQPVAQITGTRLFWGRAFRVTPEVLDPRPETEIIIARALEGPAPARIIDLGTGTGILGLTLLAEWPQACAVVTDTSAAALEVARENAEALGVSGRVTYIRTDWWSGISGRFDLIVSNPPYIPAADVEALEPDVRKWEPLGALTPGGDGLDAYRAIAAGLPAHAAPGARVLLECGAGQAADVAAILAAACGPAEPRIYRDFDGKERVVGLRFP